MRRMAVLLAASVVASLCGWLPWQSRDAADLLPVETLLVDSRAGEICLSGADGLQGVGATLAEAMADMADRAPGTLFFGQVSRVIVGDRAARVLPDAAATALLRLNTAVYAYPGQAARLAPAIDELEAYWRAGEQRGTLTTLLQYCADGVLPVPLSEEGLP